MMLLYLFDCTVFCCLHGQTSLLVSDSVKLNQNYYKYRDSNAVYGWMPIHYILIWGRLLLLTYCFAHFSLIGLVQLHNNCQRELDVCSNWMSPFSELCTVQHKQDKSQAKCTDLDDSCLVGEFANVFLCQSSDGKSMVWCW